MIRLRRSTPCFLPYVFLNIIILLTLNPVSAHAVELLQLPNKILIRGLAAFEQILGMEVILDGVSSRVQMKDGRADFNIGNDQLCAGSGAAYRPMHKASSFLVDEEWRSLSHLCSAQSNDEVTFLFISDTQDEDAEHLKAATLVRKLADQNPGIRFVLNGGDVVHKGVMPQWKTYRLIAEGYSSRIPLIPVLGNHEFSRDKKLKIWKTVYGTESTELRYYLLDFGPMALVVLDSNVRHISSKQRKAQTAWLESTLKELQGKKPILLTYHHPAFSSSLTNHLVNRKEIRYIRKNWVPLLKKYGVSMVLNGHEHLYERLTVDGVQHLLAGPAGGNIGVLWPFGKYEFTQKTLPGVRTVSMVRVSSKGRISIRTYETEKEAVVDEFEFTVQ